MLSLSYGNANEQCCWNNVSNKEKWGGRICLLQWQKAGSFPLKCCKAVPQSPVLAADLYAEWEIEVL